MTVFTYEPHARDEVMRRRVEKGAMVVGRIGSETAQRILHGRVTCANSQQQAARAVAGARVPAAHAGRCRMRC